MPASKVVAVLKFPDICFYEGVEKQTQQLVVAWTDYSHELIPSGELHVQSS